jgi:hypothetical protein
MKALTLSVYLAASSFVFYDKRLLLSLERLMSKKFTPDILSFKFLVDF